MIEFIGNFWERMELQNFPLDTQELSVSLSTKLHKEVKLISSQTKMSSIEPEALYTFRDQQKWRLYELVRVSETASYDLGSCMSLSRKNSKFLLGQSKRDKTNGICQSKYVASCFCTRRFGFYLVNAYLFNFLITAISLTNFAIEIRRVQNRLSGTFTLILTSISFKWVTNRSLPTVSYMTSLDRYQIVNILYMCLLCIWHAVIAAFFDITIKDYLDIWLLIAFSLLFILFHIYFLIGFYVAYSKIKEIARLELEFRQKANEPTYFV
jgi:hypothetical protein